MAKKSTKKNSKKVLFDILVLILSASLLGLLALPFIKSEVSSILGSLSNTISGYKLIDFDLDTTIATFMLLTAIFASLSVLFSIFKLIGDLNIVKNKTFTKFSSVGLILITFITLVLSIAITIVIPVKCNSNNLGSLFSAGNYAVWYSLAVVILVSLLSFISSFISNRK